MLVVGAKEVEENTVAVRSRENGDLGTMNVEDFEQKILKEVENRSK